MKKPNSKDIERFWGNVNIMSDQECWEWKGFTNRYADFGYRRKRYKAHRVAYLIYYGNIDDNLLVCHKCDNPKCVNPHHLFQGTQKQNMLDMVKKGRSLRGRSILLKKGELNGRAKLTNRNVKNIRKLHEQGVSKAEIARRHNTSESNVRFIVKKETWKHI